ncbi:NH(3)-dependent NAD(+) synthetase [Pseudodesulfovibrio hydrargyri]|uniref:NH(3)-dependent NAD(+) synthetase n=1 Tax=Pseudodesulfovibrio hydrargyri TaxID=2125990 RepID=A0A1J5MTE3_9BACT|nr:ATP-dependent sacrificial sulfur transferase LarE [Pseudodesulfovibrio hydrargyri]OIQ49886.1 NH(3)-dependent NAD(+) synthetase [Pseudodesulfovibrio hydrargyri]
MSIEQLATHIAERSSDAGCVAVALSGGVDSGLVAAAAKLALGSRAVACTLVSELTPARDRERAMEVAERIGIEHRILKVSALSVPEVRRNQIDRCYHCKCLVFRAIKEELGDECLLLDGTNADDPSDRPGLKAVREFKVFSPLADLGLGKSHIRALAFDAGLPNWETPSESCLATRIPLGVELSAEDLHRVEVLENYLHSLGLDTVRVRPDNLMATVEYLPQYSEIIAENRDKIVALAIKIGLQSCTFKEWVE